MYERRDSRRRYRDDRYYDDRRYDYSPPRSYVTAYSGYPPQSQAAHIVHYQPQYPQYQYSAYPHPGYPMSPPLSSAGGSYPPIMHQYSPHGNAPSQSSSSARTEDTSASIRQFQETMEKKQDEALRKQEEYFAHMRAQMDAETATRLARDKAREDEIEKQKREWELKLAADREALRRADELAAATEAARVKAEAAAAKKAKEAEDKANKEKEKYEKDLAELKKKNEDAKKAKEALKKERDALIPPADDTRAAVKFKDAGGRTWTFPWKFCKQWETMQILIIKCFTDHPGISAQVQAGRYWLFGPDEQVIMPELWEHTVQPGWEIAMQLWPLPPPRDEGRRKKEAMDAEPPAPPPPTHRKEKDKRKPSASSSRPKSLQPVVTELPNRNKKSSNRYDRETEEGIPPPPPSPPGRGFGGSEIEVVEVVTKVDSSERRKRKSPKPENLSLMARWVVGALPRERKR